MKNFLFLLAFFPLFCYAEINSETGYDDTILMPTDEQNFAIIKANVAMQMEYAATNISQMIYEIDWAQTSFQSEYDYWLNNQASGDYYRGGKAAASNMMSIWDGYQVGTRTKLSSAVDHLSSAQTLLNRLNFVPGDGSYSNVLEFIATNQFHFANNATNALYTCISNLFTISQLCQDSLPELHQFLETILPDLDEAWANIVDFFDYATDIEDTFIQFFDLAVDRLEKPQADLQVALASAWSESLLHFDDILKGARSNNIYRTQRPLVALRSYLNSDDVQLSNEGWILAESLQAQTWSYWIEVEILNQLKKMQADSSSSNSTDNPLQADLENIKTNLFLIMQHQTICQEPYYQLFNHTVFGNRAALSNPYTVSSGFRQFTNFVTTARSSSSLGSIANARLEYRNAESNWFNRVETQLLLMNGLIPLGDGLDTDRYDDENLDDEKTERRIRYATNSVYELVASVSSLSNSLGRVLTEYRSFLDSFVLPGGQDGIAGGSLLMIPEISIGGISVDFGTVTWDDLSDVVEPVRVCSTVLWYFIFGFLSFKLVLVAVYLFGRLIAHVTLVISTLLS